MSTPTIGQLLRENEDLRHRLEEAEDALRALQAGEVDAVLVEGEREQVYTLETTDKPYRLLVEQVPHAAATLTADGAILYCNRRFAELLRRPLHSLLGKPIGGFVAPDRRPIIEALLRDGQTADVQGEVVLQQADGTPVPVYLGVSALQEGALGLCLMVTDLSEQRHYHELQRTQAALRESERRFREMIDVLPVAIYPTDAQGRLTYFNPAAVELSGRVPELQPAGAPQGAGRADHAGGSRSGNQPSDHRGRQSRAHRYLPPGGDPPRGRPGAARPGAR